MDPRLGERGLSLKLQALA